MLGNEPQYKGDKPMKLWDGRFQSELNAQAQDFNASIRVDRRMAAQDIAGSVAHARMLGETGIIPPADAEKLVAELETLLAQLAGGQLAIDSSCEDIHSFVEATLTARLGDAGKRLHTARSRNDQVALDLRLHLKQEVKGICALLVKLLDALCTQAGAHAATVMPGYTHLQRAQPITFGHHLMAYAQMFLRDQKRLCNALDNMNECPLGAGALAGTTYPIDRHRTAALLGFAAPAANSLDAVADRDFCVELAAALSLVMTHLSRFCEEIIFWCSWECKFIELSDAFSTGSSIMPQKKNPDVAELIRGKTGRVYGDLFTLLTIMKGLPLAYNKDMQEDKEAIFDAVDTVALCLGNFTPMLQTMCVNVENMRAAASAGFINATDCADYLTAKGLPFRDAYKITGQLVAHCIGTGQTLESLPLAGYQRFSPLFTDDIYTAISLDRCVAGRTSYGGPAPQSVQQQIQLVQSILTQYTHES